MIEIMDKVQHKLSGDWLIVIDIDEEGVLECRTKSLDTVWVHSWEVFLVEKGK